MCGIAGLILSSGAPPPDPGVLSKLIGALHHRGPDGSGHAVMGRVALVHNRLAIIDLVTRRPAVLRRSGHAGCEWRDL